jgi:hypothetical protein
VEKRTEGGKESRRQGMKMKARYNFNSLRGELQFVSADMSTLQRVAS